jgi:hypothetical protein
MKTFGEPTPLGLPGTAAMVLVAQIKLPIARLLSRPNHLLSLSDYVFSLSMAHPTRTSRIASFAIWGQRRMKTRCSSQSR